ncbi:MAG: ABC transporter ATP-binding protein [candidate division WOR-3 bacterium]
MEMNSVPILQLINVTRTFDGLKALDSLSLSINRRTITAIVGPNGSGKTTLFNVITGLLRPGAGTIIFKGRNITYLAPDKIARSGIGRTFQAIRVFPQITVIENMLLALEKERIQGLFYGLNPFIRHSSEKLTAKAVELLSMVELRNKINEFAGDLSHGQRRLLEIMRAVALDADLYLFDEPTAGVFPEVRTRILNLFKLLKENGKTIIFVEHNMDAVLDGAQRVIVLDKGKIIADGEPGLVLENEKVVEAYFGG